MNATCDHEKGEGLGFGASVAAGLAGFAATAVGFVSLGFAYGWQLIATAMHYAG